MSIILNNDRSTKNGLFYVGDLVMARAALDAYGTPWVGIITHKDMLVDARVEAII